MIKTWCSCRIGVVSTSFYPISSILGKLVDFHEKQILAGVHRGRINMTTSLTEPYYILDLPSYEELHKESAIVPQPRDAKALRQVYKHIRMKRNPIYTHKINLYFDRFMKVTFTSLPSASVCQNLRNFASHHLTCIGVFP